MAQSLIRDLPRNALEYLSPSPPIPHTLWEEVVGLVYYDLPGIVWDQTLGVAVICNFPVGFTFVTDVVRPGYSQEIGRGILFSSPRPSHLTRQLHAR